MEKTIKPYGKAYSQGREYFLLEPHARAMSDGTFELLVVPFWDWTQTVLASPHTPRFIRTTAFLLEHSDHARIQITVSEETEE